MDSKIYSEILLELRKRKGINLRDLNHVLPSEYQNTDHAPEFLMLDFITNLMSWGLIEAYKDGKFFSVEELRYANRWEWPRDLEFFISKQAIDIEKAFGINFNQSISTLFGESRLPDTEFAGILVLMPFAESLKTIYDDHIKASIDRLGFKVNRADDLFSNGSVMADVWTAIRKANIIIADCTGRNPNVFYEIGISHTLSKETILIAQSIDDIPFDLRHLRVILYQFTPKGMKTFEETLYRTIETMTKNSRFWKSSE